ncbi:hypothetical protein MAR_022369 [Mya arenaria]|uniref:Uncharacterized protein n=1 Tax=Mya arenaria TaxID=6604 RepID=A0ABY7DJW5_MYAAR|nr:hypothetical protein MAR_022369 [Mya arenaria]
MLQNSDKILHTFEQTDNKDRDQKFESQASDHCIYDDASSSAGDEDYDPYLGDSNNDYDGVYNVQTNTVMETNKDETYAGSDEEFDKILQQLDQAEDLESEFDAILRALNAEREPQETYVQRFAERRDRYGFILSPVMEASSPSPSLLSGYSGVSCASPDRFDTFRMSPAIGAKPELDLASLRVKSPDLNSRHLASPQGRDDHDYTVPIFQARRAIVIPEVGYGWDSGDDLLSPTVSCEWDKDEHGGLNTPPVSTSGINFTQFGTRIGGGWRQTDVAIHEENEDQSDDTVEANSDSDTDTTIESDPDRNSKLNSSHNSVFLTDLENTIGETRLTPRTNEDEINHNSADELLELEEEIDKITHELSQINRRNESLFDDSYDDLEASKQVETSDTNISVVSLESSLNDSYKGFSAELYKIHHQADRTEITGETMFRSPVVRLDSKQTLTTSDDDESHSTESNEDAEDEYSESDDENVDFEEFKTKPVPKPPILPFTEQNEDSKVLEVLSPRSAIILSGGMFPHETESSSYTSSTDDEEYERTDRQLTVKQYTSGDSDTSAKDTLTTGQDVINKESDTGNKNESQVKVSFRQMYELKSPPQNQSETVSSPSKSITIHSPMDYYLLEDTKIDTARKTELRQSPRIFGRYYAEMDKDIVNEVRSPREKENAINFENNEINNTKPEVDYLKKRQQLEDSFTDVVLTKKEQLPFMTPPDKQAKSKESQPSAVKIKIGHLHRSSSARSKVKRGYVHELSEIFDQKKDHTEKHVVVKKENIKQEQAIIRKSPEKLTANENIIITQEDSPAELFTMQEFNSSQGFEVTPLTKVETFHEQNVTLNEVHKHEHVKYRNTDDTHDDNFHDNVHSNSDLEDTIEAQMKLYEDHLKTADTSGDEANDNDYLNATEPFEPHVGLCSLDMPLQFTQTYALNLAAANISEGSAIEVAKQERVKEDRRYMEQAIDDEEIPEIIDGDSSDLSSDEEYHNEYHLTGNIIHPERDGFSSVSSTGKIHTRNDNNKAIYNVGITQQKTGDSQEIFKRIDQLSGSLKHGATKSSPRSVTVESDKHFIRSLSPTVTNTEDDGFSLVSYDVKTPLSPLAYQQRINNGSNTITDLKINEAQHDTGEENNTLTNAKQWATVITQMQVAHMI